MAKERLAAAEKERNELLKTKSTLESSLKSEFESRLGKALEEADRAYKEEREQFRWAYMFDDVAKVFILKHNICFSNAESR